MDFLKEIKKPPQAENFEGLPRHVGVEIEFAGVSAKLSAQIVADLFGGTIREEDAHRFHIENTRYGKFTSELDSQYAHRAYGDDGGNRGSFADDFQMEIRRLYGDFSSAIVPSEIVCPPIGFMNLPELDRLVEKLQEAGAEGTQDNLLYAFGAQLNPDIASRDAEYLTAMLKAYLLLSPWLREVMRIDVTRRLVAFADPFPASYVDKVLADDYWPDQASLINDYLKANPTRNRELDMLPLFMWLNEEIVRRHVPDPRIKSRPTFHYRLPDARISQPDWSIALEWNRWVLVETLANDREVLERMSRAYRSRSHDWLAQGHWVTECSEWLLLS